MASWFDGRTKAFASKCCCWNWASSPCISQRYWSVHTMLKADGSAFWTSCSIFLTRFVILRLVVLRFWVRDSRVSEGIVCGNCKCELQVRTSCLKSLWTDVSWFFDFRIRLEGPENNGRTGKYECFGRNTNARNNDDFLIIFTFLTEQRA